MEHLMNYMKLYNTLIETSKSKNRIKHNDEYFENHHILPKCLGGSDDKSNLVLLTAKEHYIAHYILTKIHPNNVSIISAFWFMCNATSENQQRIKVNSRTYSKAKQLLSKIRSENWKGENNPNNWNDRSGENNGMYGVHRYGEENPFYGKKHTEESKRKQSEAKIGKYVSEETKQKLKEVWNKRKETEIVCPHCNKTSVHPGIMKRYHFDNCKFKVIDSCSLTSLFNSDLTESPT